MSDRIGVIIHRPLFARLFHDDDRRRLELLGPVRYWQCDEPPDEAAAKELLADCRVAISSWKSPAPTPALLAACPRLGLWEYAAGSVKRFWGPHLPARGITVATCNEAIAENVAEFVLAQLVLGLRRAWPLAARARDARLPAPPPPRALCDSTVGVIAASAVGRRVIALLRRHEARVLLFDPFVTGAEAAALGAERTGDLTALCAKSDAITIHTPLLPTTRHLLGADQFRAMPDDAIFINTARGGCVDEAALCTELARDRLFAFLDVTDPEPTAADSPLRFLTNVVLTPHIAGNQSFRLGRRAVDDVAAFLRGDQPGFVVTADMLDRIA